MSTFATAGSVDDVRRVVGGTKFARLVLVPHERMSAAQLAWHRAGGSCWGSCRGWWRVLVVEGGQPTHQWRCPTERSGERLVKALERALQAGTYPVTSGPSAVSIGGLLTAEGVAMLREHVAASGGKPKRKSSRKVA